MTQPGRAAIEIIGDASKLGPQLERDAQRAINDVDLNTSNISKQIGDGFRKGADEATDAFDVMDAHFAKTARNIRDDADGAFDHIGKASREAAEDVRSGFLRPLTNGFSRLGEVISSAGSSLAGLALTSANPAGLISLAATVGAVILLTPVVISLAAALADLAGFLTLLPAAVGVAASSVIVLTVAFQGFGDALSAIISGDPDKISEALKKLAPAARQVAREFERVLPLFRQVGDSIQQEFFEPLVGQISRLGTRVLPQLRGELDTLAQSLGRALGHFGDLATDTKNVGILEQLLGSTARITDQLGASFADLGQAFINAIGAGLPSLETLSTRLADAVTNVAAFINTSVENGSFQAFLDDAIATLDELLSLGGAVGELLGVLFGGTDEAGRDFIGTITDLTQRMTEFFKSAEGQDALKDFGEITEGVGIILGFVVNVIRETIDLISDLDDAVLGTIDFFDQLGSDIADVWNSIVATVSSAIDSIGHFFSDIGTSVSSWWDGVVETVSSAIDTVVGFFSALPGRISEFVQSIPGRVAAAFDAMVDAAITILATMIATVIVFFTDLPTQIAGALSALTTLAVETFNEARQAVIDAFNGIVAFIQSVPALLAAAWDSLTLQVVGVFNNIKTFVLTTWEDILTFFSELGPKVGAHFEQVRVSAIDRIAALIEYVKSIPGRVLAAIGDLGRLLYNAGANVIQGLIDGISSRIGQLRDKIASAVQTIRDHLPFSPAKTGPLSGSGSPQIAGAVIAEMIAAGLDAGTPLITQAAGRAAGATTSPFGAIGQAGVTPLISPSGTAGGTSVLSPVGASTESQPVFIVQIGNEQIEAFVDRRVDERVQVEVRRLMAGTRGI